jgi:DNA repair exonuclease SbcCD nuclease subunit
MAGKAVKAPSYLLLGDIHLSDRPPSSCTDSYLDDLFDLLGETVTLAGKRKVSAVIWAGDVFHHKTPGRTSHATVRRLIDLARTYPCPVYVVPGNHDLSNDRIASIDEGQPLGVMLASGAVRLLQGWPGDDDFAGVPIHWVPYGVPWLMRFDDDLVGQALHDWTDRRGDPAAPGLVVAHAPLYPPGEELAFEYYPTRKWSEAMGGFGSVYYGHVHEPHGVYTNGGVSFCNPGALSRGSLHEHNLTRPIRVAIWKAGVFELVELPHRPADEVFVLATAAASAARRVDLNTFLAAARAARFEVTSIEAVMDELDRLDYLEPAVRDLAKELLREAAA